MSVINKMLRDLDSRQAGGPAPASTPAQGIEARSGAARNTLSVKSAEPPGRQAPSLARALQLVTTALTVLGVAAWWYLNQSAAPGPAAAPAGQITIAKTPIAPAPPSQTPLATSSVTTQPGAVPRPKLVSLPAAVAVPVPKPGTAYLDFSLKMDNLLQHAPSPKVVARPLAAGTARAAATPTLAPAAASEPAPAPAPAAAAAAAAAKATAPAAATVPQGPVRASAAQQALAQAQQLWNAGSRSAAIDLLHEALTLAERASQAGAPSGSPSVVAAIARELARMELAEGQVAQVLALLTRLEPVLSGVADIWAIRGNAAQRLGQHSASASAYLTALKLRPNEPRWMLGAAVSLAAQGQAAAAAELAEKARDGGALTPEVANYLRQLGVPLRER